MSKYLDSPITQAVEAVKLQYKGVLKHEKYVSALCNVIRISIHCKTKYDAEMICNAWATAVRQKTSEQFFITCNYIENGDLLPLFKVYDMPSQAPYCEDVKGCVAE